MRTVAIIPARGGSRRIPMKNIRDFHGKPIIAYSIEAALESDLFDTVYVSTDNEDIVEVAGEYGAAWLLRPATLADDETGTQEVMRHHLLTLPDVEFACCIYPCAPMLTARTLRKARALLTPGTPYVVPVGTWLRDPGQFYFGDASAFRMGMALNTSGTKIVRIDANTDCDINLPEDWARAELMYAKLMEAA